MTGIIAAVVKKLKTILRLQAITRMMQKSGNQFCSACSFDLSTCWFLKSTPSLFQVLHYISYCQPPKKYRGRQYYSAGAYLHFCLLLNLQINPISTFSQHISSAVSHHTLLFVLFGSISPLHSWCCNEDEYKKLSQKISEVGKGRNEIALDSVFPFSFCEKVP